MTETQTFDLTEAASQLYKNYRPYRFMLVVVAAIMAVATADSVITDAGPGNPVTLRALTLLVAVLLCAVLVFVIWAALFFFSPSAEHVELSPDSVKLRYRGGRVQTLTWSDPKLKLRLSEFTPQRKGFTNLNGQSTYTLWGPWLKYNRINAEVFDGLIKAIEAHGLKVTKRRAVASDGTTTRIHVTHQS
jgi:hypothetical protein